MFIGKLYVDQVNTRFLRSVSYSAITVIPIFTIDINLNFFLNIEKFHNIMIHYQLYCLNNLPLMVPQLIMQVLQIQRIWYRRRIQLVP